MPAAVPTWCPAPTATKHSLSPTADDRWMLRCWHDPGVIGDRRARYATASASLASLSDSELAALVDDGVGVGGDSVALNAAGVPVFAKRVALTGRELARPHSTANLFDLPMYCQYGVGGPGFGGWRELSANLIVTDGVLPGETQAFPLLYHWRVLPGRPAVAAEHADIDAAVAALDASAAVRTRLQALAAASSSLVLFFEHIPRPLLDWLFEDPLGRAETVERQMSGIVAFLRRRELLHMDGHFGNMLTDRERIYLADFGLATSPRFDLSSAERDFAARNVTHDARYASMQLVNWLVTAVCQTPANDGTVARNKYVRQCAAGYIPADVPPTVTGILARHATAAATMNGFYWKLFGGDMRAEYPAS